MAFPARAYALYRYRANRAFPLGSNSPHMTAAAAASPAAPTASAAAAALAGSPARSGDASPVLARASTPSSTAAATPPLSSSLLAPSPLPTTSTAAATAATTPVREATASPLFGARSPSATVSEHLRMDATADESFSLSVLLCSLPLELEQRLRQALARRLSRGYAPSGVGQSFSLASPAADSAAAAAAAAADGAVSTTAADAGQTHCYYYVLRSNDEEEAALQGQTVCSSDYVLAFLRTSEPPGLLSADDLLGGLVPTETPETAADELDLFREELDDYCRHLARTGLLQQSQQASSAATAAAPGPASTTSPSSSPPTDKTAGATPPSALQAALEGWHDTCIGYLPRCTALLSSALDRTLHARLTGRPIAMDSLSPAQREDMQRFLRAISLTTLLQTAGGGDASGGDASGGDVGGGDASGGDASGSAGGSAPAASASETPTTATLQQRIMAAETPEAAVLRYDATLERFFLDDPAPVPPVPPPFCVDWALAMLKVKTDAVLLKRAIHGFELRVIQEINIMKRLISQAEGNHYALWNAFAFLRSCQTPQRILFRCVASTLNYSARDSTKDVMEVLFLFMLRKNS